MIRRLMLSVCVVLLCTSVAYAAAASVGKVRDLFPDGAENENVDGVATLVWSPDKDFPVKGDAQISVVITGFQPNTTYGVVFLDDAGDLILGNAAAIQTNPSGNGNAKFSPQAVMDVTSSTTMKIFFNNGSNPQVWDEDDEIRAFGFVE